MIKKIIIVAISTIFIASCSQMNPKHNTNSLCSQIRNQLMYSPSPLGSSTKPSPITTARLLKEYKSYNCEKRREEIEKINKTNKTNKKI